MKNKFISFEGIDGVGKTTQINLFWINPSSIIFPKTKFINNRFVVIMVNRKRIIIHRNFINYFSIVSIAFSKTLPVCSPPILYAFALSKLEIFSQLLIISSAVALSPRLNPSDSIIFETE